MKNYCYAVYATLTGYRGEENKIIIESQIKSNIFAILRKYPASGATKKRNDNHSDPIVSKTKELLMQKYELY